jgi:predicted RNA-binding protein with PIN domain
MLIYLIDAFNVIHKVPQLTGSSSPRNDFVNYIRKNNLTGSSKNKVVVVFDGYPPISDSPSGQYDVVFSCDASADDVIKKRAGNYKNKKELVVVTDDRAIRDHIRQLGAGLLSVTDFLNKAKKPDATSGREAISDSLAREITDEMSRIWDREKR